MSARTAQRSHSIASQSVACVACVSLALTLRPRVAVTVKGIKIVDSETKNEALRRLKAEQALSLMETD